MLFIFPGITAEKHMFIKDMTETNLAQYLKIN